MQNSPFPVAYVRFALLKLQKQNSSTPRGFFLKSLVQLPIMPQAIERGEAKLVVVAKDVSPPEIVMHLPLIAKEKGVLCVEIPSKEELGSAAGIGVPTVSVAIVDEGEAKSLIKEIVEKAKK